MRKLAVSVLSLGAVLLLASCSSQTGTLSREPVAFLAVAPVRVALTVRVDGGDLIALEPQSKAVQLRVKPGRHRIQIFEGSVMRVDREVFVSDQQTLEIHVP